MKINPLPKVKGCTCLDVPTYFTYDIKTKCTYPRCVVVTRHVHLDNCYTDGKHIFNKFCKIHRNYDNK